MPRSGRFLSTPCAAEGEPAVRTAGTYYLSRLDPKRKAELLGELEELSNLNGFQTDLAKAIAESADADEWKMLTLIVRRANNASRVRLLESISHADTPEGRKHKLSLLAEYLTDDACVDLRSHLSEFWRAEVRNFTTAMQLATLLKLEEQPEEDWTAAQWTELRARTCWRK